MFKFNFGLFLKVLFFQIFVFSYSIYNIKPADKQTNFEILLAVVNDKNVFNKSEYGGYEDLKRLVKSIDENENGFEAKIVSINNMDQGKFINVVADCLSIMKNISYYCGRNDEFIDKYMLSLFVPLEDLDLDNELNISQNYGLFLAARKELENLLK
jgi:hypothetical protein